MNRDEFKRTLQAIADTAQSEANEIKTKLQAIESEITNIQTRALATKTDIDTLKQSADSQKSAIDTIFTASQADQNEFDGLMQKVRDKNEGVVASLSTIATQKEQIDSLSADISTIKDDLLLKQKDATDKSKTISEKYEKALETDKEASRIKDDIEKTYKLATHLGLAGSTTARKRELNKSVNLWLGIFVAILGVSAFVIIDAVNSLGGKRISDVLLSRSVLITPLIILAGIAYNQFRQERRLLEEYAFKAAMAQALESYANVLNREFGDKNKDKILEFVTNAMNDIYDRSNLDKDKTRFSIGWKSDIGEVEAKVEEQSNRIIEKIDSISGTSTKKSGR